MEQQEVRQTRASAGRMAASLQKAECEKVELQRKLEAMQPLALQLAELAPWIELPAFPEPEEAEDSVDDDHPGQPEARPEGRRSGLLEHLHPGASVSWIKADDDVPLGSVGTVIRPTDDGSRVDVKFSNGVFNLRAAEIVATEAPGGGLRSWEAPDLPASSDGGWATAERSSSERWSANLQRTAPPAGAGGLGMGLAAAAASIPRRAAPRGQLELNLAAWYPLNRQAVHASSGLEEAVFAGRAARDATLGGQVAGLLEGLARLRVRLARRPGWSWPAVFDGAALPSSSPGRLDKPAFVAACRTSWRAPPVREGLEEPSQTVSDDELVLLFDFVSSAAAMPRGSRSPGVGLTVGAVDCAKFETGGFGPVVVERWARTVVAAAAATEQIHASQTVTELLRFDADQRLARLSKLRELRRPVPTSAPAPAAPASPGRPRPRRGDGGGLALTGRRVQLQVGGRWQPGVIRTQKGDRCSVIYGKGHHTRVTDLAARLRNSTLRLL